MFDTTAAVFDMDGTLLDSEQLAFRAYREASQEWEFEMPAELYRNMIGLRSDASQRMLAQNLPQHVPMPDLLKRVGELYFGWVEDGLLELRPGVLPLLEFFHTLGRPMAVATSTHHNKACRKLERANLLPYFQRVVGGDEVAHGKPAPDIYREAADSLNVDPSDCLAFEDSPTGLRAAHDAGMVTILIPDMVAVDDNAKAMAHYIYPTLTDFHDTWLSGAQPVAVG